MPNNKCPKKETIDKHAQDALDDIEKLVKTDRKLELQLEEVKKHLRHIMMDPHHL